MVDAAAQALADGLDSPTLRVLAGAPRRAADEEASELAAQVFEELGLPIAARLSSKAIIEGARQRARRFLDGEDSAGALARDLSRMYVAAGYPNDLVDFAGLDEWYALIEYGIIDGRVEDIDTATRAAAQQLVR